MEHTTNIRLFEDFAISNASEDGELLKIEGKACTYGVKNLNHEIVNEKTFSETFRLYNANKLKPAFTFEHQKDKVIGGIDLLESRQDGLYIKAHLNKNVKLCQDTLIPCILSNDIRSLSTEGYIIGGINGVDVYDDGSYYIKNMMLTAVSVVNVPADPSANFYTVANFLKEIKEKEPAKSKWYLFV